MQALSLDGGRLWAAVLVALCGEAGQEAPAGRPPPTGFAHRLATHYQLAFGPADDAAGGGGAAPLSLAEPAPLSELGPPPGSRVLEAAQRALRSGDVEGTALVPLAGLPFELGRSYTFSVRVGIPPHWSPWSPGGSPLAVDVPPLSCPRAELRVVRVLNRKVTLEWDPVVCDFGHVPVEFRVSMRCAAGDRSDGEAGQPVEQLLALHREDAWPPCGQEHRPCSRLEVAVQGFEPGRDYEFLLAARHELFGFPPAHFVEVGRSSAFHWHERLCEEWSMQVDRALPAPEQAAVPQELEESSTRWQGSSVLLAWPAIAAAGDGCGQLELQGRGEVDEHAVLGWRALQWVRVRLDGADYVAALDVPFQSGRFRWRHSARPVPGPASDVCLAHVPATGPPTAEVLCTTCALRARVRAGITREQQRAAPSFRVRHRRLGGAAGGPQGWRALDMQTVGNGAPGCLLLEALLGEEHGLVQGESYAFCVQLVSDCGRSSRWSAESEAVLFGVPVSFSADVAASELAVEAASARSVTFRWPRLSAPTVLRPRTLTPAGPALLECRLVVRRRRADGALEDHTSALLEAGEDSEPPAEAKVFNLLPATEYAAELSVRLARLGTRAWQPTGLEASFITPPEPERPRRTP